MHTAEHGATPWTFQLGPLLGEGSFGEVYLAEATTSGGLSQKVAIKLLRPGVDPRSRPVERLRGEARLLAALHHPAILQVSDLTVVDGRLGLVTEYVEGRDLEGCIHAGMPLRAALEVVAEVADALDAAWSAIGPDGQPLRLVHRDVKPSNIRITPHGSVKLLDFGIAKAADPAADHGTRGILGTPEYMPPEVIACEVRDALPSRDAFALGCTLFECASGGQRFFEQLDPFDVVHHSVREDRYRAFLRARLDALAGWEPQVVPLVARLLDPDHTARPSHREVVEACQQLVEVLPGHRLKRWSRALDSPPPPSRRGSLTALEVVSHTLVPATQATAVRRAPPRTAVLQPTRPPPSRAHWIDGIVAVFLAGLVLIVAIARDQTPTAAGEANSEIRAFDPVALARILGSIAPTSAQLEEAEETEEDDAVAEATPPSRSQRAAAAPRVEATGGRGRIRLADRPPRSVVRAQVPERDAPVRVGLFPSRIHAGTIKVWWEGPDGTGGHAFLDVPDGGTLLVSCAADDAPCTGALR